MAFLAHAFGLLKKWTTPAQEAFPPSLLLPWHKLGARARRQDFSNVVGYRCVTMIAEAAASIPLLVFEGERELTQHPLLSLLESPNPLEEGTSFLERVYGHLYIYGNAYVHGLFLDTYPSELYALRPDRVRILIGKGGWPEGYEYGADGTTTRFPLSSSPQGVLHLKLLNPLHDYQGLSPFEAASSALDIHNAAATWGHNLFQNAAKPSGALVCKGEDKTLTTEQFQRLKEQFETAHQGPENAGRPIILEGGLEWVPMAYSPRDIDYLEVKNACARDIALAFGIPPLLLGLPKDNTFSNYAEANRTFWRQTVIPLATKTAKSLSHWFSLHAEKKVTLTLDLENIDALSAERSALWERISQATFLSDAEKRAAVGYGINQ